MPNSWERALGSASQRPLLVMLAAFIVWIVLLALGVPGMVVTVAVLVVAAAAIAAYGMGPERRARVRALLAGPDEATLSLGPAALNARTQALADLLNRLALVFVVAALLAPVLVPLLGGVEHREHSGAILAGSAIFLIVGYILHRQARRALRSLVEA